MSKFLSFQKLVEDKIKINPGEPARITHNGETLFYAISPEDYERMMAILDDLMLSELVINPEKESLSETNTLKSGVQ